MANRLRYAHPSAITIYTRSELIAERLRTAGYNLVGCGVSVGREAAMNGPDNLELDVLQTFDEIKRADVFLAVMDNPVEPYHRTFTELAHALALAKVAIVVCPGTAQPVFGAPTSLTGGCFLQEVQRYDYSHKCMTNAVYWHSSIQRCATEDQVFRFL